MKKKEKNNGMLVGLLIGIIVMILVFVGLYLTNIINFKINDNNATKIVDNDANSGQENTNNIYVGEYTYSKTDETDGITYNATIDLLDNGTFYTSETATMENYFYGTYEIKGDELILTHLFETPAVAGMGEKINTTVSYKITSNAITTNKDGNRVFPANGDVTLTKSSDDCKVAKDFVDSLTTMYMDLQKNVK